jgi:hypothetical protein
VAPFVSCKSFKLWQAVSSAEVMQHLAMQHNAAGSMQLSCSSRHGGASTGQHAVASSGQQPCSSCHVVPITGICHAATQQWPCSGHYWPAQLGSGHAVVHHAHSLVEHNARWKRNASVDLGKVLADHSSSHVPHHHRPSWTVGFGSHRLGRCHQRSAAHQRQHHHHLPNCARVRHLHELDHQHLSRRTPCKSVSSRQPSNEIKKGDTGISIEQPSSCHAMPPLSLTSEPCTSARRLHGVKSSIRMECVVPVQSHAVGRRWTGCPHTHTHRSTVCSG